MEHEQRVIFEGINEIFEMNSDIDALKSIFTNKILAVDLKDKNISDEIAIKKWLEYRQKNNMDCDVTLESILFLKLNSSYLNNGKVKPQNGCKNKYEIELRGNIYRGDTMNSFNYILKRALKLDSQYENICEKNGVKGSFSDNTRNGKLSSCLEKFEITKYGNIEKNISRLAAATHFLSNFIAAPKHFNTGRAQKTCDVFNVALLCIWNYYKYRNEKYLEHFLSSSKAIESTKDWLQLFETWEIFVQENHLQDYLNDPVDLNSKPKELWDNQFNDFAECTRLGITNCLKKENYLLPTTAQEIDNYLRNVLEIIELRGQRIMTTLEEQAMSKQRPAK